MIPISNNIIAGQTNAVFSSYALDQFNASTRAITAGATSDPSLCLDERIYDLRNLIQEIPQTNFISNNTMVGASGGPLPDTWEAQNAPSLSQTITTSGTASGFQTVGVVLSGTADTDNEVYVQFGTSGIVSTYQGDLFVGSAYFQLSSGSVSGITDIGLEIAIIDSTNPGVVLESFKTTFPDLSSGFARFSVSGKVSVQGSTDDSLVATMRFSHNVLGGSSYDYRVIIGVPQLERGLEASPVITTSTGSVTRITGRPSILVVPQLTKSGVVYPQIPVVSGADFTFTRATTATRVNASGLIESVASGVLRLDYPIGGGCPAALIEASGTNLAWHSETWATGTNWLLTNNVTTATGTTGTLDPLGTNTANAISPTTANATHLLFSNSPSNISFTSGTIYTQSGFFKQGTGSAGRYVQLSFVSTRFFQLGYANFDLQLGTVAVVSGTSADTNRAASIENYGNGWYRCRLTATCNSGGTGIGVLAYLITASGDTRAPSFTGVTGDVLYGWGAQLETGAIPTSYIPTTTGSATRNADVCNVSGVSGYIGQTEGTIYAEFEYKANTEERRLIALSDGTASNRIMVWTQSNALYAQVEANSIILANPITAGYHKVAFAYEQNGVSGTLFASLDGGAVVSGTSATFPASLTVINIGRSEYLTPTLFWNARIRAAAIYTTRLSNDQLANITRLT